jgi:hypothetical protein
MISKIRFVWITILFFKLVQAAAAEPVLLYGQSTGEFWLTGLTQTDPSAGITLYSQGGTLLWPEQTGFLTAVPLDINPTSPTYGCWIREELGISLGQRSLPLYIGPFAEPGTPLDDFSAVYYPGKFIPSQPLPIQLIPEPGTLYLASLAFLLAICTRRRTCLRRYSI